MQGCRLVAKEAPVLGTFEALEKQDYLGLTSGSQRRRWEFALYAYGYWSLAICKTLSDPVTGLVRTGHDLILEKNRRGHFMRRGPRSNDDVFNKPCRHANWLLKQ
jgi:hypothetical protein